MSKYYDKTAASFKSVTIDTKVLDAQKILINSNPNDINQRENLLDVLNEIDVTPSYTSYQYIDYCEKSSNTGECSAVKLHANLLPHDKNIKAIRLTVANTVNTETWLVAYLVDANNNFTSLGKSINSNTWSAGDQVEWEFDKAFQIPEGSHLQLYIADANSTISANNVTRPSYKIKLYVADHSGDNQDSVRYDGTWYNQRRVYVQFKEELKQELSQYLDYKLDQVQDQVNTNIGSIDVIGQDVEVNSENIEALRQDVNSLFTQQDAVRDVNTMQGTLDNATIYGAQYSREHFGISGTQISKVTLPYNVQSGQSNTGYLVAQVFDHDNQLIANYYSEGTHTFSNAGPAVFNFVDTYIAANYKFIRFILVANKTVELPTSYNSINSNCLSFRARPIKWSDSFTFDDDDCLSYSNQSTGTQNWLIGMTIDYKERGAQPFITREEADSLYITKTEDNEHILNVLNEEVDVSYAQGWFNLETNTNAWRLRIGQYPDIVAPDNGETLEAAQWVLLINQADIPFEAYAITNVKVGIKAKQPGAQYCVSFKMYYPDNTLVSDQITYSGDTLELSGDPIKRIDYLASLNNQQQSESNIFDKTVYLKEGAVVSKDIVLNGSRLLLANGAAVEIYQGTDIPLPEGGGQNTVSDTNNIIKKYNGNFQPIYLDSNENNNYDTLDFAEQPALASKEQIIALCTIAGGNNTTDHELTIKNAQIGNENEKFIINFNYSFNFDSYHDLTTILSYGGNSISRYYYFVRNFNNCNLNNLVFLPFEYTNPLYISFNNCIINNSTIYTKGLRLRTEGGGSSPGYSHLLTIHGSTLSDCIIKIDNETLDNDYIETFVQELSNDNTCTNVKIYSLNDELLFEI